MNFRFNVDLTSILFTISTIICSCDAYTVGEELKLTSPHKLQKLLTTQGDGGQAIHQFIANEDIRLRQIKEYVLSRDIICKYYRIYLSIEG